MARSSEGSADVVFACIATGEGRARFWAESAPETDSVISFAFPNGTVYRGRIVANDPPHRFAVEYFGGVATFALTTLPDGTDVELTHEGVPDAERCIRGELSGGG